MVRVRWFLRVWTKFHIILYTHGHIYIRHQSKEYIVNFFFFSKIEQNKNIRSTTKIELMSCQKCITFHTLQIQLAQCLFLISHLWYGIPSPFDIVPQCALSSSSSSTFSVILVHESEKYRQYLCFFYAIYICICTYPNVLFILIVFAFIVIIAVAVCCCFSICFFLFVCFLSVLMPQVLFGWLITIYFDTVRKKYKKNSGRW